MTKSAKSGGKTLLRPSELRHDPLGPIGKASIPASRFELPTCRRGAHNTKPPNNAVALFCRMAVF
jgi:hypothetical protein